MSTLDAWMKAHDRDDASVAAALGNVSRSQVNRLRREKSWPSWRTAQALEKLTQIPAAKFMKEASTSKGGAPAQAAA